MQKDNSANDFDLFYLELPQADYLSDLGDIEIQDAYDENQKPVLRKEDVNKLRDDILGQNRTPQTDNTPDNQLFSDQLEAE
jgi:hypothetical protein